MDVSVAEALVVRPHERLETADHLAPDDPLDTDLDDAVFGAEPGHFEIDERERRLLHREVPRLSRRRRDECAGLRHCFMTRWPESSQKATSVQPFASHMK